jgi:phage terminase large subunit
MTVITGRSNFRPFSHQREVMNSPKRHRCAVMHRRAGKTVMAVMMCLQEMLTCTKKSPRIYYVAPYLKQSKKLAWDYFRNIIHHANSPHFSVNNSELSIHFKPNDGKIVLAGADNTDALRGIYCDFVVVDEMADCDPRLWTNVLRPALSDRKGRALICGTPRGRGNFLYDLSKIEPDDPEWAYFKYDCWQTGVLAQEEIEATRRDMVRGNASMGQVLFEQEMECSFSAGVIGAIYGNEIATLQKEGRYTNIQYDPSFPVFTAWDLGYSDSTAIHFIQQVGSDVRIIEYAEFNFTALTEVIRLVLAKGYVYAEHFAPHDIRVTEYSSGRSRLQVAQDLGIDFTIAPKWSVEEGIAAVQRLLQFCYIDHNKAERALECLSAYRFDYDEEKRSFKVTPRHDHTSHCADALRYYATAKEETLPLMGGARGRSRWLV